MVDSNGGFKVKESIVTENSQTTPQGTANTTTTTTSLWGSGNNSVGDQTNNQSNKTSLSMLTVPIVTMVSLSVTEYSWLKDFYEVSIKITNNSSYDFSIDDAIAEIKLPNGLSLADTDILQSFSSNIGTIQGGTSETATWIIKGDTKGSYNISVDFQGMLNPFQIPIRTTFVNDNPIKVIGGDALKLTLNTSSFGKTSFILKNISDDSIYNAQVDISKYTELNDAYQILLKYPSGLVEKIEWTDETKTKTKSTIYLPVNISSNVSILDLRTLASGESIEGIIMYTYTEVIGK